MDFAKHQQNITIQYCFPNNNSSCRKQIQTGPMNIFLYVFLSCVSVFTVFLNFLVIISISHFKHLHTPCNLLILSLSVADLLVGLIVMPVNMMQLIDSCWYLGNMGCCIFSIINGFLTAASLYNLTLIAVDRYIAISYPLLYSTRITVCKMSIFIILGWPFCVLYAFMYYYFNDNLLPSQISSRCHGECVVFVKFSWVIIDLVVSFVAPCSVILLLYAIIFHVARRQAKAVRAVINGASKKHGAKVQSSSEAKAARMLGIVIFVYLACWIPFYVSSLAVESVTSESIIWIVFGWLIYINSSVNPLIYAIFYPWFRESAKFLICCRIFKSSSSRFYLFPAEVGVSHTCASHK